MLLEGRRDEQSTFQAKAKGSKEKPVAETNRMETKKVSKCYSCGRAYPHNGPCPAKGKECNHCGKMNYFSNICKDKQKQNQKPGRQIKGRKKAVRPLKTEESSNSSEEDYVYAVNNKNNTSPSVNVTVLSHVFKIIVDTGATINVIDENTYAKMKETDLRPTNIKAFPYNSPKPVKFLGKFDAAIETKKRG